MPEGPAPAPSPDQTPAGWSTYAASYDDWLAPITRLFAADVIELLQVGAGTRLLDVAAGSGAVAIAAAQAGAEVLATDFAPGMVDLLRTRAEDLDLAMRVEEMDGQALALPDASFDAATSLFGLIFFPDVAAGATELLRVLRVGGRAAVSAWGTDGLAIQQEALVALERVGVQQPVRETLPAAFRLSDPARLEALLLDAGFTDVVVHALEHRWPVPDPEALFRSIPGWSAPMRPLFERLTSSQLEDGAAVFAQRLREGEHEDGLPLRALVAIGRR